MPTPSVLASPSRGGTALRRRCLSAHQHGLLDLEAERPGTLSPRYTVSVALRLRGPLDAAALAAAYDDLLADHEILRTRLVPAVGAEQAHAEVWAHEPATITVVDEERAASDDALLARLDATEIEPGHPPLVRCFLAPRGPGEHLLALVASHTVADTKTLELAVELLAQGYEARLGGRRLAAPQQQYGDHAARQAQRARERHAADHAAWHTALAGITAPVYARDVPFAAGRPPGGAQVTMPLLNADEGRALVTSSLRARSTPFMTLLAAFGRVMRAEADRDDLLLLTVLDRRDGPATRRMLGPFLALTPIRLAIAADEPFETTLASVRTAVLAARSRAEVPLRSLLPMAPALVPGLLWQAPSWVRLLHYVPADYRTSSFGEARAEVVHHGDGLDESTGAGLRLGVWPDPDGTVLARAMFDDNDLAEGRVRRLVDDLREQVTWSSTA